MNIIIKNDYRAEVLLSAEELGALDITYDALDYANIETRRVLWTLAAEVRRNSGIDIDLSGKLLIEVFRECGGKCRICFTSLPPRGEEAPSVRQLVKNTDLPLIVECRGLDDTVQAAVCSRFEGRSSLYFSRGFYRLVFRVSGIDKKTVALRLSECGEVIRSGEELRLAECEENWQCIEQENAVSKLKMLA